MTISAAGRVWRVLAALACCCVLGCGGSEYKAKALPVEGVFKWDKGPMITELEGGSVEFEKDGAVAATAALTGDGTFKLMNPLRPGTYRVRVVPSAVPVRKGAADLDPRFQSFETSGLTFTAESQPGQVTFELKKRAR
jgi:hypothetical protein